MALSGLDVANIAYRAGFRGQGLVMAIAIAKRESGWNPDAYNGNTDTGDNSIGLMQINMLGDLGPARMQTLRQLGYDVNSVAEARELLKDPLVNMKFAYALSNQGTDFYHWGGYKGEADNYNTNMQEAAQIASQATGEPVEWTGQMSSSPTSGEHAAILAQMAELRKDPRAQPTHPEYIDWLEEYGRLAAVERSLRPPEADSSTFDPNDPLNQDFQNKIQGIQTSLQFDNTNLARAVADLDRFLGLREESTARSQTILEGQDMIRRWGTSPGKSSFSLADLGSGFEAAGAISGLDPNKPFINYTGTIRIDPEADFARMDAARGVSGQAPGIPGLITDPASIPGAPALNMGPPMANPAYTGGGTDKSQTATVAVDNGPPGATVGVSPPGVPVGAEFQTPSSIPALTPSAAPIQYDQFGNPILTGQSGIPVPQRNPVYNGGRGGPVVNPRPIDPANPRQPGNMR